MKKTKIAFQGEKGAYSHIASEKLFKNAEIKTCTTFEETFKIAFEDDEYKIIIPLEDLTHIKSMTPLKELLDGEELQNPIEVKEHVISEVPRYGAMGIPYIEKKYSVWRGSQRVKAAKELGYTHIEGVIING